MNHGGCLYYFSFFFFFKNVAKKFVSKTKISVRVVCTVVCVNENMVNQKTNEDSVLFRSKVIECMLLLPLKQQQQLKVAKSCEVKF
jgi:hypothetical protein